MKKIILILMLLMIGVVSAVTLQSNLNLTTETKNILEGVGKGIGTITKERMLFDENGTNYLNETYLDELKLIKLSNNEFKLYQEGGINKEFKVKLEKICTEYNETEEGNYCINYRSQTNAEIQQSAEAQAKQILNKIASVTLDREARSKEKRFEDIEVII